MMHIYQDGFALMVSSFIEPPIFLNPQESTVNSPLALLLFSFKKILRKSLTFHLLFFSFFLIELLLFGYYLFHPEAHFILAFFLSSTFLICFSYLILHYYFRARYPEQYTTIQKQFFSQLKEEEASLEKIFEALDSVLDEAAAQPPFLSGLLSKINGHFHWREALRFKEGLARGWAKQQIEQIKMAPTDTNLHASLAFTLLSLADLYRLPATSAKHQKTAIRLLSKAYMQAQFKRWVEKSMEEFNILRSFLPDDPWVHAQLASCFHDLGLIDKEIDAYENLIGLRPTDRDILLRLGILYFKQGASAKGLRIYEELLHLDSQKADSLISLYDIGLFDFND